MADKTFDELLAELEAEEENDNQESAPAPKENANFKNLRDAYKRQEKELKQLREFREEAVQTQRLGALTGSGLNEAQARVYLKSYDEVRPDLVDEFKTSVLGIQAAPPAPAPEVPTTEREGFAPSAPQAGQGPSLRTYTTAEWDQLCLANPSEALKVQQEGRIIRATQRWTAGSF